VWLWVWHLEPQNSRIQPCVPRPSSLTTPTQYVKSGTWLTWLVERRWAQTEQHTLLLVGCTVHPLFGHDQLSLSKLSGLLVKQDRITSSTWVQLSSVPLCPHALRLSVTDVVQATSVSRITPSDGSNLKCVDTIRFLMTWVLDYGMEYRLDCGLWINSPKWSWECPDHTCTW
jgi:hypothetical protein